MPSQDKTIRIILRMQDEYSKQAEKAAQATEKMSSGLQKAGQNMKNVGANMTNIGQKMSLGLTVPLVAGAAAAIKAFTGFEDVMAEIAARTGSTADEMDKMSKFALKMGADTKFSATQAAQAMLELTASGSSAVEAMAQLPAVLDLAAAGGIELGRAADGITDVLKQFKLEMTDGAIVADALARAAGSSSATVDDLMNSMANGGNVASSFGFSVEETAAILAVFAENGVKGAEAGTQLRSMLLNMTRNSKPTQAAWRELGVSMFDATGKMRPLNDVIKDMNRAMEGMSDQQRLSILKDIGGSYGQMGLNALLAADGTDAMSDAMTNAASASEVAQARMNTLAGRFESLMGSLETLGITLVGLAEGPLNGFIQWLTQVVNAITAWVEANPRLAQMVIILLGIVAALGPVLIILGQIIGAVGTLITAFSAISAALPAIGVAIGAVSLPLVALIAAIVLLGVTLAGSQERLKSWGFVFKSAMTMAAEGWKLMIPRARQALSDLMGILKAFGQAPIATMRTLGKLIMQGFIEGFKSAAHKFLLFVKEMAFKLQNTVKKAFKIRSPSKVMMELGSQVGEGFNQGIAGMGNLSPTVPQLSSAAAGAGGGSFGGSGIYINNLNVPPGTTREQVDAIMTELGKRAKLRGARAIL